MMLILRRRKLLLSYHPNRLMGLTTGCPVLLILGVMHEGVSEQGYELLVFVLLMVVVLLIATELQRILGEGHLLL